MKRLMHPANGFHVPENSGQLAEMLKAGWVECTPEMWAEILAKKRGEAFDEFVEEAAKEVADLAPKRKPGRPAKAK